MSFLRFNVLSSMYVLFMIFGGVLFPVVAANSLFQANGWVGGAFDQSPDAVQFDADHLTILNKKLNDSRWKQTIQVPKGSNLHFHASVLTQNVSNEGLGVNWSIEDGVIHSESLHGSSNGWVDLDWYLQIPGQDDGQLIPLTPTIGIGGYGSVSTGQASFDQLSVETTDVIPVDVQVSVLEMPGESNEQPIVVNPTADEKPPLGVVKYAAPIWQWIALIVSIVVFLIWSIRWKITKSEMKKSELPVGMHIDVWDGLRGLAILLVVWFHVWQVTWYNVPGTEWAGPAGFIGVEIFFFISGCCLFYPYARFMWEKRTQPQIGHFFYRRMIKILPSYYLSLILFVTVLQPEFWQHPNAIKELAMHIFFIENFDSGVASSINGVYWSLAVEVQFYLIFPWIAMAMVRRPIVVGSLMIAGAIGYRWYAEVVALQQVAKGLNHSFGAWMHQLPAVLDLFAMGMLTALIIVMFRARKHALWMLNSISSKWLAMSSSIFACVAFVGMIKWLFDNRFDGQEIWQAHYRWLIGLILMFIVIGGAFAWRGWQKAIANPVLVFLSLISYNLYIWHQWVARTWAESKYFVPLTADPHQDPMWEMNVWIVSVLSAIAWTGIITWLFERPLLKHGFKGVVEQMKLWRLIRR